MHRLLISYGEPADPGAFDAHYRDIHAPLAGRMPGLVSYTYGHGQSVDPAQSTPYLLAELDFDSVEAMGSAFASTEGQAAAADVATFATGGATMT
ncbi:MAG: Ethyl tert-butyl ether degradation EthD, partial [Klenkia sp.]|nr:Ethyl tert-butyl ether degradation EthD [Klenkia sp.]